VKIKADSQIGGINRERDTDNERSRLAELHARFGLRRQDKTRDGRFFVNYAKNPKDAYNYRGERKGEKRGDQRSPTREMEHRVERRVRLGSFRRGLEEREREGERAWRRVGDTHGGRTEI